ncbi:MarR family winged helix-turn-helix transcriptional regulator [Clostridium beijerinckii]|uniref:MarR family transcriptional regulator n=2 Tax=Clostridium TaxID=1485 RepID=A0A7X9XQ18_CLOBE|nr:MarR family transcriptional regulator [Clostridium beijerinckii]NMF05720.1 MarR family transcriptional regulator [Clostridium beijerinckii]
MMNINSERKNKISYILLRILNRFDEIDKKTHCYGTDTPLFSAEINMLRIIKENEGIHVTGIADKLGVTKGAVSQIVNKLNKKGLIKKETDLYNQSKLMLSLTSKGEIAELNHEKLHDEYDSIIDGILKDASNENIEFLKDFLNSFENQMEFFDSEFNK